MTFVTRGTAVIDQLRFREHVVRVERVHFQTELQRALTKHAVELGEIEFASKSQGLIRNIMRILIHLHELPPNSESLMTALCY